MAKEWQRIAIRPSDYQKLKVLTALENLNGGDEVTPMADYVGKLIDSAWEQAKQSGSVSDGKRRRRKSDTPVAVSDTCEPEYADLTDGA